MSDNKIRLKQNTRWGLSNLFDYLQSAYLVMLALGGLSDYLDLPKLAIGFVPTLLLMVVIREATPWGLYHPQVYHYNDREKRTEL